MLFKHSAIFLAVMATVVTLGLAQPVNVRGNNGAITGTQPNMIERSVGPDGAGNHDDPEHDAVGAMGTGGTLKGVAPDEDPGPQDVGVDSSLPPADVAVGAMGTRGTREGVAPDEGSDSGP